MDWAEDLPEGCPPEDTVAPNAEIFFRAVLTFPPTESDFYSPRKLYPDKEYSNECEAKALSVFSTLDGCQRLQRFSFFRNHLITSLPLGTGCGLIKSNPSATSNTHYDWWLAAGFNPVPLCTEAGRVL